MKEDFLHYLWNYKLIDVSDLKSDQGLEIQIVKFGSYNTNAGPDFFNAKIKIGETCWAGNVEMHLNSSDWLKHNHQNDTTYNNVILHVVLNNDADIKRKNGEIIPTLEIKNRFNPALLSRYQQLMNNTFWVPCGKQLKHVDFIYKKSWLERVLVERLTRRSEEIIHYLKQSNNNWQEVFYCFLARSFGFNINAEPFELLAKSLPLRFLASHKNDLFQIESLLFGQAGLLQDDFVEDYPKRLKNEYKFLSHKYKLHPINQHLWKYLRLRPMNFPTIRLAQFAQLIHKSESLFSKVIESKSILDLYHLFNVKTTEFWQTHYRFGKSSHLKEKALGRNSIDMLLINTVIPFLFVYGKLKSEEIYQDKALAYLEEISAEKNAIVNKWREVGIEAKSALDSQGLLELKKQYCNEKKCLSCALGNQILKDSFND